MITMILFLSVYNGQAEADYESDYGTVSGAQTNEAPVKYAIKRLAKEGKTLDRIIAVATDNARKIADTAKETALDRFTNSIKAVSPAIEIIPVEIKNDADAATLLEKTFDKLLPLDENESVIIDTTGGFRTSSSFLSLISRFLQANDTEILFSTYADFYSNPKRVKDASEIDELHVLLEAVNVFTATGNPALLIEKFSLRQVPNKSALINALENYYEMLLCCKIGKYEKIVKDLREEINKLLKAEFAAFDVSEILFRDIIRQILPKRTPFIFETSLNKSLKLFIEWCLNNNYMQQAVTVLMQKFIHEQNSGENEIFERIKIYRNDISHADWEKEISMINEKGRPVFKFYTTKEEIKKIRENATVPNIKKDVEKALKEIKDHNTQTNRIL